MKVETHPEVLQRQVFEGAEDAAEDLLDAARASAPVLTGEYRDSLQITGIGSLGDTRTFRIGSPLPQARAVEFGANVGHRVGPHMRGVGHLDDAVMQWPRLMTSRLRSR